MRALGFEPKKEEVRQIIPELFAERNHCLACGQTACVNGLSALAARPRHAPIAMPADQEDDF